MNLFFIAEVLLNNSFQVSLSAPWFLIGFYLTYSFLLNFLGLGRAGVTPEVA